MIENKSDSGLAEMSAVECLKVGRDKTQGPAPVHSQKSLNFWAKCIEKRSQPGNCSKCGNPNPLAFPGTRGMCPKCRMRQKEWKQRKSQKRKEKMNLLDFQFLDHEKRLKALELRFKTVLKNARQIQRNGYNQGHKAGQLCERRRFIESRSEWEQLFGQRADLIGHQLEIKEAKQMSHVWDS